MDHLGWGIFCLPQRLLHKYRINTHIIYILQLNRHYSVISSHEFVMFTNYQAINYNISSLTSKLTISSSSLKSFTWRPGGCRQSYLAPHFQHHCGGVSALCSADAIPLLPLPLGSLDRQAHLSTQTHLPIHGVQPRFAKAHSHLPQGGTCLTLPKRQ